jgi:serine phosphatase RsbU (regulator of sigma subunit)
MGGQSARPEIRRERIRLIRTVALGLLVFAAGVVLALLFLPEWQTGPLRDEAFYQERFREVAERGGFRLAPGEPRVRLTSWSTQYRLFYRIAGEGGDEWLTAHRAAVPVEVRHHVSDGRAQGRGLDLFVLLTADGRPWGLSLWPRSFQELAVGFGRDTQPLDRLGRLMLEPGERLGPGRDIQPHGMLQNITWRRIPIEGPSPQMLVAFNSGALLVFRTPLPSAGAGSRQLDGLLGGASDLWRGLLAPLLLLGGGALFLALAARDQIGPAIGAALAALCLVTTDFRPTWYFGNSALGLWSIAWLVATVFVVWSSGESLLRSQKFDFTTSLDNLRAGRLGPRGGRALIAGFGYGAGLAGVCLALAALAVVLPGLSPIQAVPDLPVFRPDTGLVGEGLLLASTVALVFALASRFLAPRWAAWAAALLAAPLVPLYLIPHSAGWLAQTAGAAVLVAALRRRGLAALLTAAVVGMLLPAALWSALHLPFMAGSLALTAGIVATLVALGVWGLGRPAEIDAVARPPRFVRRLEERRRRRYETDLLARMQADMLPERIAAPPGYEVAARAVLAQGIGGNLYDALRDSGGGFWLVSGDVAGQGLACSIAQAMIKAALHSLVAPDLSPSEVLAQTSRVLRGVDPQRNLAAVALIRLDPATGEGRLANAGHPAPLRVIGSDMFELGPAGPLLGEPATEGEPDHPFHDVRFALPPGGALLLVSETLFDERDRKGVPFGIDRVRAALQATAGKDAEAILDGLLRSWRRHLGSAELTDDTTAVVVRRLPWEGV